MSVVVVSRVQADEITLVKALVKCEAIIMKPYVVVKFEGKDESVAVVPSSWISQDKLSCKWPPKKFSTEKITRLIISLSEPTPEFNIYSATVMHEYDKYRNARKACKLAEDNSDLDTAAGETDLEGPRKNRKTKRLYDSEESNDESLQIIRKKTKEIIYSDSDEDNEISNAQEIKEKVRELLQKKKDYPKKKNESGNLPVKNPLLKSVRRHNDMTSAVFNVATKDATLPTNPRFTNSLSVSEEGESSSSLFGTINTLSGYGSNNDEILSDTHCNTSEKTFAKTLLPEASLPIINDDKCESLLKVIIEQIEEVNGKLDHVNMSIARVYRKLAPEDESPIKPKGLPALPLKDEEAFYAFEEFLKNDENFIYTIDYFVLLMPTRKTEEAIPVGRLLAKVFSNSLARIINYSGSGFVKLKLQGTNILTVIECAIVKKIPSCDVTEVQSKILRWFSTSNQRKMNA